MEFELRFRAACGYAELGMMRESLAELNAIDCAYQDRPEVLQLRLHHLMRRKNWERALVVSRKLCRVAPQYSAGFLHAGFACTNLARPRKPRKFCSKARRHC